MYQYAMIDPMLPMFCLFKVLDIKTRKDGKTIYAEAIGLGHVKIVQSVLEILRQTTKIMKLFGHSPLRV